MAYQYPEALQKLINELSRLPGLGPKAAQRLSFHLLAEDNDHVEQLASALTAAKQRIHACPCCGNFTDSGLCAICADPEREAGLLCIVEQVADIMSMERSNSYNGLYHVLGGSISPMDGIGPDQLNIKSLNERLRQGPVREIIMATNPTMEGEATAQYLAKRIKPLGIKVSRIAHGMPVGGSLAYADEATLALAINDRKELP